MRKTAARSSNDQLDQLRCASRAASMAWRMCTSAGVAVIVGEDVRVIVRHDRGRGVAGADSLPPITNGMSIRSAAIAASRALIEARSGEPAA